MDTTAHGRAPPARRRGVLRNRPLEQRVYRVSHDARQAAIEHAARLGAAGFAGRRLDHGGARHRLRVVSRAGRDARHLQPEPAAPLWAAPDGPSPTRRSCNQPGWIRGSRPRYAVSATASGSSTTARRSGAPTRRACRSGPATSSRTRDSSRSRRRTEARRRCRHSSPRTPGSCAIRSGPTARCASRAANTTASSNRPCFVRATDPGPHPVVFVVPHAAPDARRSRGRRRNGRSISWECGMGTNEACTQCHPSIAANVTRHTNHGERSSGSACYNCHMPYTTYGLLKTIRSHTIGSPSVAETLNAGRPNACNLCHVDKTLRWTSDALATLVRPASGDVDGRPGAGRGDGVDGARRRCRAEGDCG